MSDNIPYVAKAVLKLYDISTPTFVTHKRNYIVISVHVILTPKEESSISPRSVRCYGVVNYYTKGRRLEEMMLTDLESIPILSYIDDNKSFYDFIENIIMKVADEKYDTIKEK
jgi:hypothetical protein